MPSTLTPEEQAYLGRLLTRVVEKDNGFIPDAAYRPIHKLVPWPAVEVLIYDSKGRFLLSYRDDDFRGWHIPGGFMKPNESVQEACNRNARKEKITEAVRDPKLISMHVWRKGEHPFGFPISLTVACKPAGEIEEREDLMWFDKIPNDIIPQNHPAYLAHFKSWLMDENRPSAAIL